METEGKRIVDEKIAIDNQIRIEKKEEKDEKILDIAHRKKISKEIFDDLSQTIACPDLVKLLMTRILAGEVRNLKIIY